ncbi:hypothetical protein E2C01_015567 [Portunus trituberculatus]|uniref:Uncharacterized protein n=1 Tax=Portunus trituberculatus TaxID=210409 RepID=A0A5B7DLW5_PORTR|nr:hypothetical protein [Portunus trituberculatus]
MADKPLLPLVDKFHPTLQSTSLCKNSTTLSSCLKQPSSSTHSLYQSFIIYSHLFSAAARRDSPSLSPARASLPAATLPTLPPLPTPDTPLPSFLSRVVVGSRPDFVLSSSSESPGRNNNIKIRTTNPDFTCELSLSTALIGVPRRYWAALAPPPDL